MLYYFAYGSNLHPLRLKQRVSSAELVGITEYPHHRLTFHKKSHDGSSKCNMLNTGKELDLTYGAIYQLNAEHKTDLDRFEGKGCGYIDKQIKLHHNGKDYTCFTYFAQQTHITTNLQPYHWYKQLVVLGAVYLAFPDSCVSSIEAVESIDDPDLRRRKEMDVLIKNIIKYR